MDIIFPIIISIFVILFIAQIFKSLRFQKRQKFIDSFVFPASIAQKVGEKYPHLTQQDREDVITGLREYFHICNISGQKMVSMPSQVVDVAWHEFILFTRMYEKFCTNALGYFLHHTPAEAMASPLRAQEGIKRAWRLSCYRENIPAKTAHILPMLFGLDALFDIEDGFKYSLNCNSRNGHTYCAGHIGCSSGCAGGGAASGSSDGCSGGCGGGD